LTYRRPQAGLLVIKNTVNRNNKESLTSVQKNKRIHNYTQTDIVVSLLQLPSGEMVRTLDWRLKRVAVRLPAVPLSGKNFRQVVHTHTRASVTKQYKLVVVKGR